MRRRTLVIILVFAISCPTGCSQSADSGMKKGTEGLSVDESKDAGSRELEIYQESEGLAESYRSIYEAAWKEDSLDNLETMKRIVECIGDSGYAVADSENQINMENPEQVRQFCEAAEENKRAEVTLFLVEDTGGFIRYDLQTDQGEINVMVSNLEWEECEPKAANLYEFPAYTWSYTEKGYLFFEEYRMPGYDGPPGHIAIRVEPLDEVCREWTRMYLEPIGYGRNNLFITEWNETDYGELNFYDLFEILYPIEYGNELPYEATNEGKTYEIPETEFEAVLSSRFQLDRAMLRQKTIYHAESSTYQLRPRGLYDSGPGPTMPYPEVTAYEENADGTIKLTVDVVWPRKNTDHALTHEVVVRPLTDGTFQYVSNHVIPADTNLEPVWYKERVTDEELEKYYGIDNMAFMEEEPEDEALQYLPVYQ